MAGAIQRQGYTRTEALQVISAACDEMRSRYAGFAGINLAFVRAIQGAAQRQLRAAPSAIVLPMSGQGTKKGKTK